MRYGFAVNPGKRGFKTARFHPEQQISGHGRYTVDKEIGYFTLDRTVVAQVYVTAQSLSALRLRLQCAQHQHPLCSSTAYVYSDDSLRVEMSVSNLRLDTAPTMICRKTARTHITLHENTVLECPASLCPSSSGWELVFKSQRRETEGMRSPWTLPVLWCRIF